MQKKSPMFEIEIPAKNAQQWSVGATGTEATLYQFQVVINLDGNQKISKFSATTAT